MALTANPKQVLYEAITGDAAVASLLGGADNCRIWPDEIPSNITAECGIVTPYPFVVYRLTNSVTLRRLDGDPYMSDNEFEIIVVSNRYDQALQVAEAIIAAIQISTITAEASVVRSVWESESQEHALLLQAKVYITN